MSHTLYKFKEFVFCLLCECLIYMLGINIKMQDFRIFSLVPSFSNIVIIHSKTTFTGVTVLQVVHEVQGQDQICPLKCQSCHFFNLLQAYLFIQLFNTQ